MKTGEKGALPAGPAITGSFAAREVRPGQTWKIYLRAAHLQGEMKAIHAAVIQPGRGPRAAGPLPVPEDQRRELSGFLHLGTAGPGLAFVTLTLQVEIRDETGTFSEPVFFPLALNPRAQDPPPAPRGFRERDLGPILIPLEAGTGGG